MFKRRHSDRFKIPGAQVLYKLENDVSAQTTLINMTKNSVCFEVEHPIKIGYIIELEIIIPEKDIINVKGNIVWTSTSYAVVQFLAFGTDERCNSMHCLKQLNQLAEEYLQLVE